MTADPRQYHNRPLPPAWVSKAEHWWSVNKIWVWIILYILFFFVWPFFIEDDPPQSHPREEYIIGQGAWTEPDDTFSQSS